MRLIGMLLCVGLSFSSLCRGEWVPHPAAVQTVYQQRVPHTDRHGRAMETFDPARSFFPLTLYHALHGEHRGRKYDLADYAKAGFNSAHFWEGQKLPELADAAAAAEVQLIVHWPSNEDVKCYREHPAVLAWYLDEEPTGGHWDKDMEGHFQRFLQRRGELKQIDPHHPVFALDVPWITAPATDWWIKWNTAGDISVHDNYPVNQHRQSLSFDHGIPETVGLAVKSNEQKKPVWICLPTFEQNDQRFQFSMPSSRQLRCMAYTSIVHGATGLMYFALDSWVTRNGSVVGMAPDATASYGQDLVATADQLRLSRELWQAAVALNREIEQLRPALLSPTAKLPYEVHLDSDWPPVTPEPIRTLLKTDPSGGFVLLVVNIDASPQRVRIVFPDSNLAAEQLFESQGAGRFSAEKGGFQFLSGPYDVRAIRLKQE